MCICFTSIAQNVWTAASMKTYICYDHRLHILCRKLPNFKLFILFGSVHFCFMLFQKVCPVLYVYMYEFCLAWVSLSMLSLKGFCSQRIRKHSFKYITSLVVNRVFVTVFFHFEHCQSHFVVLK
jgi:hypothetical protein